MAEYRVTTEPVSPVAGGVPPVQHVQHVVTSQAGGDDFTGDDAHVPHKPADDTEQIYFEGSPMLRAEMGRNLLWVLLGCLFIAAPVAYWALRGRNDPTLHVPWWVYAACAAVGLVLLFIPWVRMKTVKYRISNYRIDFQRGLVGRTIDTMELWHVEDIRFHQSFIDRILAVGQITVLSHDDTTPKLILWGLPNPKPLFEMLKQRIIAVKRQRGVVKMDMGT